MEVLYSPKFEREYKKLSAELRALVNLRVEILKKDPFSNTLRTHKLTGELDEYWSFSINYSHRALFQFSNGNIILCSVGDHTIYD